MSRGQPLPDLDASVHDWMLDVPGASKVFARFGLDTSCGGKSLDYVCRQAGVDPREVLTELSRLAVPGEANG